MPKMYDELVSWWPLLSPAADYEEEAAFYQRVLDHLPSPVLVLRSDGTIVYGNQALLDMSGWTLEDGLGIQMLDVVHPDDQPWVIEAFGSVVNAGPSEQAIGSSWSPVRFRIICILREIAPWTNRSVHPSRSSTKSFSISATPNCWRRCATI